MSVVYEASATRSRSRKLHALPFLDRSLAHEPRNILGRCNGRNQVLIVANAFVGAFQLLFEIKLLHNVDDT